MDPIPLTLALWAAAHALYLAAAVAVLRHGAGSAVRPRPRAMALLLAVGLVPRLLLLPAEPALSEDAYRYLWDGRLVAHGQNPFSKPPSDPAFASWHDGLYARLNHADVPTIYPPAAQGLFALAWRLGGAPVAWKALIAWKALLLLLEAALVAGLAALLRRRGLPVYRLLLYYWNPLVVVECYGSGHVDLAAAAFLILALLFLETGRRVPAGVAVAAAALVKLVPVLWIPALARRREWIPLVVAGAFFALLYLPFLGAGSTLFEGLRTYARHWEFNGSVYAVIRPFFRTGDEPRWILAAGLAAAVLAIAWRARTLSGALLAAWMAFLLLSPTVYPWYLVPAIALLPLHPDPGLLAFSGTVALTYLPLPLYRSTGVWSLPSWIPWVEYGSLAAAWVAWLGWRRFREAASRGQARTAWATESSPT